MKEKKLYDKKKKVFLLLIIFIFSQIKTSLIAVATTKASFVIQENEIKKEHGINKLPELGEHSGLIYTLIGLILIICVIYFNTKQARK
jgi:hypothetical protein